MTEDQSSVAAACQAFGAAMLRLDFAAMEDLWDRDYEHLVYQPEEYESACRSWDEIVAYWNYIPGVVERILEWRAIDSEVAVVGDAAIVYSMLMTSFQIKNLEQPLEGKVRLTYGLRRTPDGWRFIHCHESRQLVVDDTAAG